METKLQAVGLTKNEFTKNQLAEIEKGVQAGLDVSFYAQKEFLAIQMQQIRLGLEAGIDVSLYANTEYDWFQMEEIRRGLQAGLDISLYASPDISYDRMQQIRLGLEEGINLSDHRRLDAGILRQIRLAIKNQINIAPYILAGYDDRQLEVIRMALEKRIDIRPWVRKEYRGVALLEIVKGLENGLDVSVYAKPEYNWQQMREIRLGLEHMVDVEQYNHVFFSCLQMKEIREGLEEGLEVSYYNSLMYTARQMHSRRLMLQRDCVMTRQESKERVSEKSAEKPVEDRSMSIQVSVSENEMEAYLKVCARDGKVDKIAIVRALRDNGICFGIRYDVIEEIISGSFPGRTFKIAEGKERINGKDGWYEFFFRTDFQGIPKELDDGSLDYWDVQWFETVEKGQKLAVYHSSDKGKPGITITGKEIPAKHGREKGLLLGKGFSRLSDEKTYIADCKGVVTLKENQLNVSELLVLQEVNITTGNVIYDGNILIEGNVCSGSTIKASKDIVVKGFVEAAQITSGGSVYLQKGMNGSGEGKIRALKDVVGYFFEGVDVYAGGMIQGDYFFKSALYARGMIKCAGNKGVIAGGIASGQNGIRANGLGNQAGLVTQIVMGRLDDITKDEAELQKNISSVTQELRTLRTAHRDFQKKYPKEIRHCMEIYLKIESAIYTKEKQMEKLLEEKNRVKEEKRKSSAVCAIVSGQIYEGVNVEIDGIQWQAKPVKNVTVKMVGKRISVFSNK